MANATALVAGRWAGCRVVWNLRSTGIPVGHYGLPATAALWLERALSKLPDAIIVNSEAGRAFFASRGFSPKRLFVIHNGIDTERFSRTLDGRAAVRGELGVEEVELLVGLVARLDPMKDHESFLRAAAAVAADRGDVRFLCAGGGDDARLVRLKRLGADLGLGGKVSWVGDRRDMPAIYSALDVLVLASAFGEGFPNVVGEAMACEVPCVVTDVGDSALIVGESGRVVRAGNPSEMAAALQWSRGKRLGDLGQLARKRVESLYNLDLVTAHYWKTYEEMLPRP
jgi:glycosyltransferase involved in cell wall biosynthesis